IGGLTTKELHHLENMEENVSFVDACVTAAGLLLESRLSLCIIVDGIDKVAERTPGEALGLVLNALIRAAQRLTADATYASTLAVKVLMPRELFVELKGRDMDHLAGAIRYLYWHPSELKALLNRRIGAAAKRKGFQESTTLGDVLPDGDMTFEAMLRH